MERFSVKEVLKNKFGEAEKSKGGKLAKRRAEKKSENSDSGKYKTKIVDGVKYMVLK